MLRDEDGNIKGSADVLIRTVPVIKASLLYCCRGFVADEDDFATFEDVYKRQLFHRVDHLVLALAQNVLHFVKSVRMGRQLLVVLKLLSIQDVYKRQPQSRWGHGPG